jgi:hypothetical protein
VVKSFKFYASDPVYNDYEDLDDAADVFYDPFTQQAGESDFF